MNEQTCENCKYFYQHYVKLPKRFTTANCGHCVYPRMKKRTPDNPACEYFCAKIDKL
ncbi:hypothetical protein [Agathobaculum sp.]|uniref:hypothetical protein n=1 Tax=Agathobaculum sp. TaxID=2048138 RepID=UPI002A818F5E|nr:hypothetical protein [Agathobaculum sp.]MDY3618429.1 hypothetical protein [Agathobaculum sp.]